MSKTLKAVIIAAIVIVVGLIVYFFFTTKSYWENQMRIQNENLELRTQEGVDSLLTVIHNQDSTIEYYQYINENHQHVYDSIKHSCDSIVKYYKTDNTKLMNIINHQNQMIDKLMKEKN